MINTVMQDLCNGKLAFWERKRLETPNRLEIERQIDVIKEQLTQGELEQYEMLESLQYDILNIEKEDSFTFGLRFGILLMSDVFTTDIAT